MTILAATLERFDARTDFFHEIELFEALKALQPIGRQRILGGTCVQHDMSCRRRLDEYDSSRIAGHSGAHKQIGQTLVVGQIQIELIGPSRP